VKGPNRFYLPTLGSAGAGDVVELGERQAAHALRVKRHKPGDIMELFDGKGRVCRAVVVETRKRSQLSVRIDEIETVGPAEFKLHLATAVPRGDRMEVLLDMTTQLGVDRITPLVFDRSTAYSIESRVDRWQRVIAEACKQCGRNFLTTLEKPADLVQWLHEKRHGPEDGLWVADPEGDALTEARWQSGNGGLGRCTLVIGPEGGVSPAEAQSLRAYGFHAFRLGDHILRVETAAVAASAVLAMLGHGSAATRYREPST
jgi:16S rRNA (uracil1498-N3)-methyltransferase